MKSFIRSLIILLISSLCSLNFGCRKNENPVHTNPLPPANSKHPITIISPKAGDVWYRNFNYDISWKINGDSVGQSVYVSIQRGMNQPFEPLFTAQTDSLKRKLYVTLDTSTFCRIRIRGSAINGEFDTSGVFSIIDNPYTFLYPHAGDTAYQQKPLNIILKGLAPLNVSIDLSIDGGTTWKEIIKPNANLTWIVDSPISNDCILRTRDVNGKILSTSDCCFRIIDWYKLNFSITSPKEGDVLHQWTKIPVKYINQTPLPVAFDFSSDDGNTWTQIIPFNSPAEWSIAFDPSENCRLRMHTSDTSLSYMTGRFKIISELDEFFPLQTGMVFHYEYHHWNLSVTSDSVRRRFSVEIISSTISHDTTVYICRVSNKWLYPVLDSSTTYEFIYEYNQGLHPMSSSIAPFSFVPVYRYTATPVSEKSDSYNAQDHSSGWSWTQKKGLGITSYSSWSGHQMNTKGDSYTLL